MTKKNENPQAAELGQGGDLGAEKNVRRPSCNAHSAQGQGGQAGEPIPLRQAPVRYLKAGLSVMPTQAASKRPTVSSWKDFTENRLDPNLVPETFQGASAVAVVCGQVSGGLECIDFDYKGMDFEAWKGLVESKMSGLVARLVIQRTQSGGRHAVYRIQGGEVPPSFKLTKRFFEVEGAAGDKFVFLGGENDRPIPEAEARAQGIPFKKTLEAKKYGDSLFVFATTVETRGEAAYFLAAPSPGYELIQGSFTALPEITPEERQVLIDAARELDETKDHPEIVVAEAGSWREHKRLREGERLPGDRFNQFADPALILEAAGWTPSGPAVKRGEDTMRHFTRPGKSGGVSGTLINQAVFYNFSSNADPLDAGTAYDAFGLRVRFEFEGNFKRAAAALMKEGVPAEISRDGCHHTVERGLTDAEAQELYQRFADLVAAVKDPAGAGAAELTGSLLRRIVRSALPPILQERLFQDIKKAVKISITAIRKVAEQYRNESEDDRLIEGLEGQLAIAKEVVNSFGVENLIFTSNMLFVWGATPGVWARIEGREVQQRIHALAPEPCISRAFVESVADLARTEVYRPNHEFDAPQDIINCLNGALVWAGDAWELQPSCREHFRTTQLPVAYDPEAEAPRFEQFLREIFKGDADAKEKGLILCEALGYSLLSTCRYEKFILLIGPGANGKSVFLAVVVALIGAKQVSAVQPAEFQNRFQRAHLHGKLVNVITEIAEGAEINDDMLKALVSGELTTAENKHQAPFDFRPYATNWFGSNHLPATRDFSSALFRRAIVVPFNRTFCETEQDPHLVDALKKELPGILNLALDAIGGVFKRGTFTQAPSVEDAKRAWRLEADQAAQFLESECELAAGASTPSSELYFRYEGWARREGIKRTLGHKNFAQRLTRLGPTLRKGTGGRRMLDGIKLVQPLCEELSGEEF